MSPPNVTTTVVRLNVGLGVSAEHDNSIGRQSAAASKRLFFILLVFVPMPQIYRKKR